MSTDYIVAFEMNGNVKSINSVCTNRDRLNIKHPLKGDRFTFTIDASGAYSSVRVFTRDTGGNETDAPELFKHPSASPSAYVPFNTLLTVCHNGANNNEKIFYFTPSGRNAGDRTATDPGSKLTPPDIGTIKVGG